MTYGYARCSLAEEKGQDLNRQVRELKAAGAEEIITEREHGDARVKQNLDMLLEMAREGDTIITLEVSRLSRSIQQLCEIINMDLRTLSEILGHTKVSLTLQLYAHSTMETKVEAMNCIEKYL